jgi:hypothetical protein
MTNHQQPYGLALERAVAAGELQEGAIVVLDGHVVERSGDPDDPGRVRLTLVTALGPPPGRDPDRREIVISAPRDMRFATARPQNIELAPLPGRG